MIRHSHRRMAGTCDYAPALTKSMDPLDIFFSRRELLNCSLLCRIEIFLNDSFHTPVSLLQSVAGPQICAASNLNDCFDLIVMRFFRIKWCRQLGMPRLPWLGWPCWRFWYYRCNRWRWGGRWSWHWSRQWLSYGRIRL